MTAPRSSSNGLTAAGWLCFAALAALYAAFGAFQAYDYDLPLHLITGESILEDFRAAEQNQFSFTYPGYPWLNDKWLENVVVHLVDQTGGAAGLVVFRLLLVLTLGWLLRGAMNSGIDHARGEAGVPAMACVLLAFPFVAYERFTLRPELFSLLGIAALLWIVARDARGRREWLGVAALHAVWVNLHGYWFVGILILGAFFVGDGIESWVARWGWPVGADRDAAGPRARYRGTLLLAALGGALFSPHPIRLFLNPFVNLTFVFRGEGNASTISELRSPFDPDLVRNWAVVFFYLASAALLALLLVRWRRVRPSELFLTLGFFLMAAVSRRNIGMFAVVAAVTATWWLARGTEARESEERTEHSTGRARALATGTVAGVALAALLGAWLVSTDRFYASDGTSRRTGFSMSRYTYPAGMVEFMLEERPPGPFFNDFAAGSYLAYRLFPDYRIFISGNTFKYPAEFFQRYYITSLGRDEYREVAEEYDLQGFAVMYSSGDMMPLAKKLFNDPDYTAIYFDDNALLYARRTPEMASFIRDHRVDFAAVARSRAQETPDAPSGWFTPRSAPRGELNRATFLHRVGLYPMAEVEYRRALQVAPAISEAAEGLGEVLLGQGRFQDALSVLEPLHRERPDHVHLLRDLAQVHSGLGSEAAAAQRWPDAVSSLETALTMIAGARRLEPEGDPMTTLEANNRFNLGFVLLQQAGQDTSLIGRADQELDAAVALRPDDAPLRFRVARLRARQGRTEEALQLLAEALETGDADLAGIAARDPAFAPLRSDPRFQALVTRSTN